MHFSKIAVAATAAGVVSAQDPSICDKYTTALLKNNTAENQLTVITLIVKTVALGSFTGPGTKLDSLPGSMVKVPGILAPATVNGVDVNLMPYFSGEFVSTNVGGKASSVNWLDSTDGLTTNATYAGAPGSKTNTLMTHLVEYFGAALGCSLYGQGAFPAYAGDNSQYNVHKFMALTEPEVTYFIQQVGAAAESFGVTADDAMTVGNLLNKLFNYKCSPPTTVVPAGGAQLQSICQDESCPTAPNATCPADYSAPEPSTISSLIPSSTAAPASSTSAAATGAVSVIPDGQPQTGPAANRTSAPAATFTGAAAATGISAALAGVAGLLAFLI